MTIPIQPGISLTVIPTEKFKTIRLFIRFSTPHTRKKATSRTLLTSLLETNSLNYPTQTALSAKLAELYGVKAGDKFTLTDQNGHRRSIKVSKVFNQQTEV